MLIVYPSPPSLAMVGGYLISGGGQNTATSSITHHTAEASPRCTSFTPRRDGRPNCIAITSDRSHKHTTVHIIRTLTGINLSPFGFRTVRSHLSRSGPIQTNVETYTAKSNTSNHWISTTQRNLTTANRSARWLLITGGRLEFSEPIFISRGRSLT